MIRHLLCSEVSQRRIACVLGCNRKTVARKLTVLAHRARENQKKWLLDHVFKKVQFDDLETIEHTKLKPVTVTLVVSESRKILGFGVAQIPAKGHLAKLSRKKYGIRLNKAPQMRKRLFESLRSCIHPQALIESDEHPHYQELVRKYFPRADYQRFKGKRGCVSGQGELKKTKFDPLFKINHTFAMLRANINRLIRRTWCTTKCLQALEDHLALYVDYHNQVLT